MLTSRTTIHFIPHVHAIPARSLEGSAAVVIDVLRATTTITAALASGCTGVIPCRSVAQARSWAEKLRAAHRPFLLAGERGGLRISGFDLGNSPAEFGFAAGRIVILAHENGTRALAAAAPARRVFTACLNNLTAAAESLARQSQSHIWIIAAGELGKPSEEDTLAAGLLIRRLISLWPGVLRPAQNLDRPAKRAYAYTAGFTQAKIQAFLRRVPHGKDLVHLGFEQDVKLCGRLDSTRVVGRMTPQGWVRSS